MSPSTSIRAYIPTPPADLESDPKQPCGHHIIGSEPPQGLRPRLPPLRDGSPAGLGTDSLPPEQPHFLGLELALGDFAVARFFLQTDQCVVELRISCQRPSPAIESNAPGK